MDAKTASAPGKLILVRHGQSTWNVDNLFTGWTDVELSDAGRAEAAQAGREVLGAGLRVDLAFTSVLRRAIHTLWLMLDAMDRAWLPVERSWRLNERHYGALQGLNKAETLAQHGEAPLALDDQRHPRFDERYAQVPAAELPATESLKDTLARVLPYWHARIAPELRNGRNVMVVAHGNSLRAMVKMLDRVSDAAITELNIPTGVPLLYELDAHLQPQASRYLGNAAAIAAAAEAVKRQAEKR
jgi:2,3-bisphosphoglycerate-dependent phosphoglycerate mutase